MKRNEKKHILLGIPTRDMVCHVPVVKFALECMNQNSKRNSKYRFSTLVLPCHSPTEYARNVIVTAALAKKNVDYLWFIDEDMVPPVNPLDMLKIEGDIVACPCPILTNNDVRGPSFSYNYYQRVTSKNPDTKEFLPTWGNGVPTEVDGAGTACMILSRRILEDKRLWLDPEPSKDGVIAYFQWPRDRTGKTLATDDLDFCARARDLGYKVVVVPRLHWGHLKEIDLEWIIHRIDSAVERIPGSIATVNEWNQLMEEDGIRRKRYYNQEEKQHVEKDLAGN